VSDGRDDGKTREQLLAEIDALKAALERRAADPAPAKAAPETPAASASLTRRESLVGWVAPVILSMPVVQGLALVAKPGTAYAQAPTTAPTTAKKGKPTFKTTAKPTFVAPTFIGRCVTPTVAPVLGVSAAPDTSPLPDGFVPLGSARQAVAVSLGC
jgi:hypothetical protein